MPLAPDSRLNVAAILRTLLRARWVVAVGAVAALLLGMMLVYKVSLGVPPTFAQRGESLGVASAGVLVDSKSSQAVDLGEEPVLIDIPGLIARARLLANLIATSPLRDQIARRAQIDPDTFLATAPSIGFDSPKPPAATSQQGRLNVMNVTFNEALPIVTINAEAAEEATAARISTAAATELGAYLDSLVAQDQVTGARQLVIKPLGAADSATVFRGPRRLTAVVVFVFVFGFWCVAIVVVSRLKRLRDAVPSRGSGPPVAVGQVPAPAHAPGIVSSGVVRRSRPTSPPVPALPERPERPRRGVSA